MQVNAWGPHGWFFLHTITFNYTPDDDNKVKYKSFFGSICSVLPCRYCCNSFAAYSKAIPIEEYLDSREGLTYWLYVIHNLVNQKICKDCIPFKDVVIQYESIRAKCGTVTATNQVEIKTCQIKQKDEIDHKFIDEYVKKTLDKYQDKTNNYIKNLFENPKNPNKESVDAFCKNHKSE
jgi:hypothetical protein